MRSGLQALSAIHYLAPSLAHRSTEYTLPSLLFKMPHHSR